MKLAPLGNQDTERRRRCYRGKRIENTPTNSQDNTPALQFTSTAARTPSPPTPRYLPLRFESETPVLMLESISEDEEQTQQQPQTNSRDKTEKRRHVLIYLIRHGEAEHNILEKKAMQEARAKAMQEGLSEDHPETKRTVEEARKSVLNDERLRDAGLSDLGRLEAKEARNALQKMIEDDKNYNDNKDDNESITATTTSTIPNHNHTHRSNTVLQLQLPLPLSLQQPSYILVSPLTRALETANIIFPDHRNIHVREDLAERRTGKPPDTRSSCFSLVTRESFKRFSLVRLQNQSMEKLKKEEERKQSCTSSKTNTDSDTDTVADTNSEKQEVFIMRGDLCQKIEQDHFTEEDKEELRKRTERLFVLLGETDQTSIAVVTHKGYLRELERGPLGQTNAKEFKNCEIRAYKVTVSLTDHRLINAERVR